MATCEIVYNVHFNDNMGLVLANKSDVKSLIKEDEELFDMLINNELKIIPTKVMKNSKMYKTAVFNSKVSLKKK